ncbi:MAG: hypothetical protein HON47_02705 [Candidatus Diapherotrites archaeon]|jgi:hypothetical protein|uniref:Uncharacterized protein n=1 Tax=Candidatus Iainarchaeum sp. TaxID=3101447 RepID=A0A8T5GFF4_9ARCH|nr:hypothetical protein [Candidatus Diapherotrites archaeon]MBT7241558.1 hypothetical protein [Candidatus Diapherotrites archaeon]
MKKIILVILILLVFGLLFGCDEPICGNGLCETGETELTCSIDCEQVDYCGDGICNGNETTNTCQEDCPSDLITVEGTYSGFYNFPRNFFDESNLTPTEVVEVTDQIYLLEVELSGGKILFDSYLKVEYIPEVYGMTTEDGFALGDAAFPSNNNNQHAWDVISHEIGHAFWANSNFYYTLAVPGPFLQEATAVLTAQYVYEKIKEEPDNFNLSQDAVESLGLVYTDERNYQKSRYEEYISLGMPYSQDESGPNYAILTSQALNYKWFLIGDEYGWKKFQKFYNGFSYDLKDDFTFWEDGVSDIEETTYMVAALNVAFEQDFRQDFLDLNFPIDNTLYSKIYPIISDYINPNKPINLIIETNNFIENGEIDIIHLPSNLDPLEVKFYLENDLEKQKIDFNDLEIKLYPPIDHNPSPLIDPYYQVEILSNGTLKARGNSFVYLQANLKSTPSIKSEKTLVIIGEPEEIENGEVLTILPRNYYPEAPDNQCEIDMNCFPGNKIYDRFGEINYHEVCNEQECIYETGKYCVENNENTFCSYKEQGRYPIYFMLDNYEFSNMINLFYNIESQLYNEFDPYPNSKQVLTVLEIPGHCGGNNNPLETSGSCYINTNDGSPQYDIIIHEMGHNFADKSKGLYTLMHSNNDLVNQLGFGECVASLPVQYIRAKLRDSPKDYNISFDSYESKVFGAEQTFDDSLNKQRFELFEQRILDKNISGIHDLGGDVSTMCSLFVTPAAYPNDFNNNYGWEFYKRFLGYFGDNLLENFEETKSETYFAATYSAAIGRDMKNKFIFWGFEIDETYFDKIYNQLKD